MAARRRAFQADECPTCGAPVSPFVSECPFCGADVRRRARLKAMRLRMRRRIKGISPKRLGPRGERPRGPEHAFRVRGLGGLSAGTPYAVGLLVLANLFAYLAFDTRGKLESDPGALSVAAVRAGEWGRLITYQFLHSGLLELVFSLLLLVLFAVLIERRYGHLATIGFYLVAGVGGGLLAVAVGSATISAGSLVSTFGLMGAWLVAISRPHAIEDSYPVQAGLILVGVLFLYGALQTGVDLWAQVGGLVSGVLGGAAVEAFRARRAGV